MSASKAEKNLLGAIILNPKQYRTVAKLVSDSDFEDARHGDVFAGVGQMIAKGDPVDPVAVMNRWADWSIRGIEAHEVFDWADASVVPFLASEYAQAVRDASVRRQGRNVAATMAAAMNDSSLSPLDAVASAVTRLTELRAGAAGGMSPKTLAEILNGSDAYDWIIPGLLERKDRLVLTGAEGAGKTTFVRQLAILAAAGIHPLTYQPIEPVSVLVVDAENTERQWRRATRPMVTAARRRGVVDPAHAVRILAGYRIDITKGPHLSQIHELIDIHKPDVLFIGPLYKLVAKAINSDDDAAPLIVALDSLRERDIALVMEAHAGKSAGSDGERDLRPRGSAALLGWPEFGMGLRHTEDPDEVQVVRWRGDRDARDWPKRMRRGGEFPWLKTL